MAGTVSKVIEKHPRTAQQMKLQFFIFMRWAVGGTAELLDDATYEVVEILRRLERWAAAEASKLD